MDILDSIGLKEQCATDLSFLYQLFCQSRRCEPNFPLTPEQDNDAFLKEQFEAYILHLESTHPHANFEVIWLNNEPVGRLYTKHSEVDVRVLDICLLPQYRGLGIAAKALQIVIDRALNLNLALTAEVHKDNSALSLYQKQGFEIAEMHGNYCRLLRTVHQRQSSPQNIKV